MNTIHQAETISKEGLARSAERIHGLDALRGVALLLGVVFHSALPWVISPGVWAVGTEHRDPFLGWLTFYLHAFRLEVFFFIAGFFGAMVVGRRGLRAWVKDRMIRIFLFFVVALWPMKVLLSASWIAGGQKTGWIQLPEEVAAMPLWKLSLMAPFQEIWPDISLTHLWFLYYLSILVLLAVLLYGIAERLRPLHGGMRLLGKGLRRLFSPWLAPVVLAILVAPIVAAMDGFHIDTPDKSFVWHWRVLIFYGLFFGLGWYVFHQNGLLREMTSRWKVWLPVGIVMSLLAVYLLVLREGVVPQEDSSREWLRWPGSLITALCVTGSLVGWTGWFLHVFDRESALFRYLADSSYWIYVGHLPLVTGLQVALVDSGLPWWVQIPLINLLSIGFLLIIYEWGVRYSCLGVWMNGRRFRQR